MKIEGHYRTKTTLLNDRLDQGTAALLQSRAKNKSSKVSAGNKFWQTIWFLKRGIFGILML